MFYYLVYCPLMILLLQICSGYPQICTFHLKFGVLLSKRKIILLFIAWLFKLQINLEITFFITSGPYKQEHDCCCYSVTKSWSTLYIPMDCSTLGFSVLHYLPEFAQTHVHWISDAMQPSHPLLSASHPTLNFSQHQELFQWVSSLHQVAKVL